MHYNTTPRLTEDELADLVRWFTYRMDQETRGDLMAERPVQYAKLAPGVDPAILAAAVTRGVNRVRAEAGHYHDPLGTYDFCADPRCPHLRPAAPEGSTA
jgi:hypothetical protein